jgi:hypothetical protein
MSNGDIDKGGAGYFGFGTHWQVLPFKATDGNGFGCS